MQERTSQELSCGQIDLWVVFSEDLQDDRLVREYHRLMSEDERSKELRFHFARDRERYRITRALVRTVLSRYAMVQPEDWQFHDTYYGKPAIYNGSPGCGRLRFNISHTHGLIMLGVTSEHQLGVDTESHCRRPVPLDVAARFFSVREAEDIRDTPPEMQAQRFYDYWTLKESFMKATGKGLSIPLDQVTFELTRDHIRATFDSGLAKNREGWKFWQLCPSSDHVAAVCVERCESREQRLSVRRIVPLASDEPLSYAMKRSSDHGLN